MTYMNKFRILEVVSKNHDISQKSIAEMCEMSVGKVNYMINHLLDAGLLEVDKEKKKHHYVVTKEGMKFLIDELDSYQDTKVTIHKEKKEVKNAVILAAGSKEELEKPACLIPIHETTLLERTVKILKKNGIENIVIVTGYKSSAFEDVSFLKESSHIRFVNNPQYMWTGSMSSLAMAREYIDDDFLLIEDDIVIEENAIERLIDSQERDCILVTKESGSGDEGFIEIRNNYLYKISKDIHQLNRIDGEMVGITKLSIDVYDEMLEYFECNQNPFMNYEYMLLDVSRKINIGYLKISDLFWYEIDNKHQLQIVKDKIYPMLIRKEESFKENELKNTISKILDVEIEKITEIKPFGGMTNKNYKVTIENKCYVVRVSGSGTEEMINREEEKKNSQLASDLGVFPELIYFNEKTGLKIASYIPNAETLNVKTAKRLDILPKINAIFSQLHRSGVSMENDFDVFGKLKQYEELTIREGGIFYPDYEEVKASVMKIRSDYERMSITSVPCHNDSIPENFVKGENEQLYLIDWEYSGMNDPYWDIATLTLEGFTEEEEILLLEMYLGGKVTKEVRKRILINKVFQDFLWAVWTIYKESCGDDFGPYGIDRYNRARRNINKYNELFAEVTHV